MNSKLKSMSKLQLYTNTILIQKKSTLYLHMLVNHSQFNIFRQHEIEQMKVELAQLRQTNEE